MSLWISLLHIRSRRSLVTCASEGRTIGKRWEWGVGKGRWARSVRRFRDESSLKGYVRSRWFLIGSRYTWDLLGSEADARAVNDS